MTDVDDLKQFSTEIDVIRDKACTHAMLVIGEELRKLSRMFPGRSFEFNPGAYSTSIMVDPPIHGLSEIKEFDFEDHESAGLKKFLYKKPIQALEASFNRMAKIAQVLEDEFRRGLMPIRIGASDSSLVDDTETAPAPGMR